MSSLVTLIMFGYCVGVLINFSQGEQTMDNLIKSFGWPIVMYNKWKNPQ